MATVTTKSSCNSLASTIPLKFSKFFRVSFGDLTASPFDVFIKGCGNQHSPISLAHPDFSQSPGVRPMMKEIPAI